MTETFDSGEPSGSMGIEDPGVDAIL
jgi:hypothetical protein